MTRHDDHAATGIPLLDRLAACGDTQSSCMFQLALMLARIADEPCAEAYKDETAQALLGLIRGEPKGNVLRLFGIAPATDRPGLARVASA